MRYHLDLDYQLCFTGLWQIGSGSGDALRNRRLLRSQDNQIFVPGSSLKGSLRAICSKLVKLSDLPVHPLHDPTWTWIQTERAGSGIVERLFGTPNQGECLFVSHAYSDQETESLDLTRTAIDRAFRTVKEGALFSTEYAHGGWFTGRIRGRHENLTPSENPELTYEHAFLIASLQMLEQIGGDRSQGKGLVSVKIKSLKINNEEYPASTLRRILHEPDLNDMIDIMREETYGLA